MKKEAASTYISPLPAPAKRSLFFQPKLTVNAPGDRYEQEADAMADRVMRMPENGAPAFFSPAISSIQRQCAACEEEQLQREEIDKDRPHDTDVPSTIENTLTSGNSAALDASTQTFMEERFGRDFSGVRVKTDAQAGASAADIQAKAYTAGNQIVFGSGQYQPHTPEGKRLIAHELTHVVQQGRTTTPAVQRSLASLTQAVRNRITLWNVRLEPALVAPGVFEDFFRRNPPNAREGAPGAINIDASVNQTTAAAQAATYDVARGLQSVPGYFAHRINMPVNTTADVLLDFSSFGGPSGVFRLTYADTNTSGRGAATNEFHIEFLSAAHTTLAQAARPSAITIGSETFTATGWPDAQYDILIEVLNRLPASARSQINGMRFRYRSQAVQSTTEQGEDGHAVLTTGIPANQREIVIWSSAAASNVLTYGGMSRMAFVIAHEIGHWLDFNPIFTASNLATPRAADSLSGYYRFTSSGDLNEAANRSTRFNTLTRTNSGISAYGGTNLAENFSEMFALFITAPDQLRLLRPQMHQFFSTTFP